MSHRSSNMPGKFPLFYFFSILTSYSASVPSHTFALNVFNFELYAFIDNYFAFDAR